MDVKVDGFNKSGCCLAAARAGSHHGRVRSVEATTHQPSVSFFFWKRTVRNRGPDSKVNSSGARGSGAPPVLVNFCFDDFGRSNLRESGQSLTLSHLRLSRFVSAFVVVSCTWQQSASARHHVARSADVRHVLFHPYGDVKGFTSNRATTVVEHDRKNASWTVPSQSQSGPCRRVLIATREMASEWSCAWQRSASVSQHVERSTLSSETSGSLPSLFVCFRCSDDSAKTDLWGPMDLECVTIRSGSQGGVSLLVVTAHPGHFAINASVCVCRNVLVMAADALQLTDRSSWARTWSWRTFLRDARRARERTTFTVLPSTE